MRDATSLPLPGFPVRFHATAVWEDPTRPCTIRVTADAPSDQYATTFVGHDTEGKFTLSELGDAMCVMLLALIEDYNSARG